MALLKIAFIHPDLGIGGAERLIVDAAVGLKQKGHNVTIFTSHHDPQHSFQETNNGTLNVEVFGDFLPTNLFGKFFILFSILRNLFLIFTLMLKNEEFDVIIVDQLSIGIPLLKFWGKKVLFYCHFPDLLLTKRETIFKQLYRLPIDKLEELTTGCADKVAVNSAFTKEIYKSTFPNLNSDLTILHPGIRLQAYDDFIDLTDPGVRALSSDKTTIVSINRFERKKNVDLAIQSFHAMLTEKHLNPSQFENVRLIIAGGYDERVSENVEYLKELINLCKQLGLVYSVLKHDVTEVKKDVQVVFIPSFNDAIRTYLLQTSCCLIYTPSFEHFGIVPIEAMYAGLPVLAVNSGGPLETVIHNESGYLLPSDPIPFAYHLSQLVLGSVNASAMGQKGKQRVIDNFTLDHFITRINDLLINLHEQPKNDQTQYKFLGFIAIAGLLTWTWFTY